MPICIDNVIMIKWKFDEVSSIKNIQYTDKF